MKEISPLVPLGDDYRLNRQFSDDFEGTALDGAKWYPFYPDWEGRKLGRFVPENVSVRDGLLRLVSRHEEKTPPWHKASGYTNLTTACVRSKTRILYGCFQMRFKAIGAAISSALWLDDSLDPPAKFRPGSFSDEIDIFECFGKSTLGAADRFYNTCHRLETPYVEGRCILGNTSFTRQDGTPPESFRFMDGFHVATFLWEPDRLRWYLDGRLTLDHPNDYYRNAMYLNIDSEPLFSWSGPVDPADLPGEYQIDYIRVWQKPEA